MEIAITTVFTKKNIFLAVLCKTKKRKWLIVFATGG
jgi:hypothetical protein